MCSAVRREIVVGDERSVAGIPGLGREWLLGGLGWWVISDLLLLLHLLPTDVAAVVAVEGDGELEVPVPAAAAVYQREWEQHLHSASDPLEV